MECPPPRTSDTVGLLSDAIISAIASPGFHVTAYRVQENQDSFNFVHHPQSEQAAEEFLHIWWIWYDLPEIHALPLLR